MKRVNSKLSEQFADFIDLTDEELDQVAGGWDGGASAVAIAIAGNGFGSCGSCGSCGGFGSGFGPFGFGGGFGPFGFGGGFGSCGSCFF